MKKRARSKKQSSTESEYEINSEISDTSASESEKETRLLATKSSTMQAPEQTNEGENTKNIQGKSNSNSSHARVEKGQIESETPKKVPFDKVENKRRAIERRKIYQEKMPLHLRADASEEEDPESEPEQATENIQGTNGEGAMKPARKRKKKAKKKPKKIEFEDLHPDLTNVWSDLLQTPALNLTPCPQPSRMLVKLLPFQLQGLAWLTNQEQSVYKGGVLADEMGLGKTIQMISLIVNTLTDTSKPTLVLCPSIALLQWQQEFANRVIPGLLKVCLFHGSDRTDDQTDLEKYNIVLSTYAIMETGFRRERQGFKRKGVLVKQSSILHKIQWGRFVLDEAHSIKDRYSSTARACFAIKADTHWCMSGTPLQNRVGELFSFIRLLNLYPHSYYFCKVCTCKSQTWMFTDHTYCDQCGHTGHQHFNYWNKEILKPIQNTGAGEQGLEGFAKLKSLLEMIMLRRTKVTLVDQLGLPPRVVECRRDMFNPAEEELYTSLYSTTARQFSTYVNSGTLLSNYASIFSLLSRMRLAANHPDLVLSKLVASDRNTLVCVICHDEAEDPIISACKHVYCREDARQYLTSAPTEQIKCAACHKMLSIDLSQEPVQKDEKVAKEAAGIVNRLDLKTWRSSTKIEALVEELEKLKSGDNTIKSLVFSQFVSFLDLVHWRLSRAGFKCVKLDGRMNPQQRQTIIDMFNNDPDVTVFLISLKAGGVALNLTEASRVFILDPWWNPAVEDQAMDRIHRLGQHRPIRITRLVIEDSIESRIIDLQQKKKALFQSTIGGDVASLERLSEEDFRFLFVL